jgi:hypothetical protein
MEITLLVPSFLLPSSHIFPIYFWSALPHRPPPTDGSLVPPKKAQIPHYYPHDDSSPHRLLSITPTTDPSHIFLSVRYLVYAIKRLTICTGSRIAGYGQYKVAKGHRFTHIPDTPDGPMLYPSPPMNLSHNFGTKRAPTRSSSITTSTTLRALSHSLL